MNPQIKKFTKFRPLWQRGIANSSQVLHHEFQSCRRRRRCRRDFHFWLICDATTGSLEFDLHIYRQPAWVCHGSVCQGRSAALRTALRHFAM